MAVDETGRMVDELNHMGSSGSVLSTSCHTVIGLTALDV